MLSKLYCIEKAVRHGLNVRSMNSKGMNKAKALAKTCKIEYTEPFLATHFFLKK